MPGGVSVTEAAQRLSVGRSVVYRLAGTLVEHGLVRRDRAGRLRLGPGVLALARRSAPAMAEAAMPALRRLAEEAGATAHLTVVEGGEAVALLVVEPSWTQFHVAYRTGSRHPLDRGAAGRAILAARTGVGAVVVSEGELQPGAYGVAAPVLGVEALEASVGVVALAPLDVEAIGARVLAAARAIGEALS
jgi:DNA-binding IclR family transcriptional regulator